MTLFIDSLDLSEHPPFAPGQSLTLNRGLTVVSGPSGSGKSVIAELIRLRMLPVRSPRECTEGLALDWTAGPHRDVELPYGGQPWPPLTSVLRALNRTGSDRGELAACVQSRVQELLQEKVSSGQSKFYGVVTSSDQIQVALSEDHGVQLMNSSGLNIDELFLAEGERQVLYLAVTAGVRHVLELNAPFVADDPFEWMDHLLRGACFRVASSMAPQVLLLLGPRSLRELSVRADHELSPTKGSDQIQVVRAT